MGSVTARIAEVKQPRGGYLNPRLFDVVAYDDGVALNENENIHSSIVGLCVDYLTRYMLFGNVEEAFKISLVGAELLDSLEGTRRNLKNANTLVESIKGLDDYSILAACKLCGYDVVYRAGGRGYVPVEEINPDADTIDNIRIMVNRCLAFWSIRGPIVCEGFTFEGGYTDIVSSGDGDYLTEDTLWDLKVSKNAPTNKHTLQILMYLIMGLHSQYSEFKRIKCLGIFNPRLNKEYTFSVDQIPNETIAEVGDQVIGYNFKKVTQTFNQQPTSEGIVLRLKDLSTRYGVSTSKITQTFLPLGLPYTKKGNAYQFNFDEIYAWEAKRRWVPYKKRVLVLPAYYVEMDKLERRLKEAKANGDKERIKELKRKIRAYRLPSQENHLKWILVVFIIIVFFFIIFGL